MKLTLIFEGDHSFEWKEDRSSGALAGFLTDRTSTLLEYAGGNQKPAAEPAHRRFLRRWAQFSIMFLSRLPSDCHEQLSEIESRDDNPDLVGLVIDGPCTPRFRLWYAPTTHRLVKLDFDVPGSSAATGTAAPGVRVMTKTTGAFTASDYKTVDGITIPHRVAMQSAGFVQAITIESVEVSR